MDKTLTSPPRPPSSSPAPIPPSRGPGLRVLTTSFFGARRHGFSYRVSVPLGLLRLERKRRNRAGTRQSTAARQRDVFRNQVVGGMGVPWALGRSTVSPQDSERWRILIQVHLALATHGVLEHWDFLGCRGPKGGIICDSKLSPLIFGYLPLRELTVPSKVYLL